MRILKVLIAAFAMQTVAFAMNDACQKEFAPLIQSHSAVMGEGGKLPKNKPKTYEQAVSNSNAHCSFLTKAQGSFTRVKTWMTKNQDFCQVPDADLKVVTDSLGTITKNRAAACNSVAQLKQMKNKAEQQQALQQQQQQQAADPFARPGVGRANDPFNPQITRKPQLSL
jgi:hypothetical protein